MPKAAATSEQAGGSVSVSAAPITAGMVPVSSDTAALELKWSRRTFDETSKSELDATLGIPLQEDRTSRDAKDGFIRTAAHGSTVSYSSPTLPTTEFRLQTNPGGKPHAVENPMLMWHPRKGVIQRTSVESWALQFRDGGLSATAWVILGWTWVVAQEGTGGQYRIERGTRKTAHLFPDLKDPLWPETRRATFSAVAPVLTSLFGPALATKLIYLVRSTRPVPWQPGKVPTEQQPKSYLVAKMMLKGSDPVAMPPPITPGVSFVEIMQQCRFPAFKNYWQSVVYQLPLPAAVAAAMFKRVPTWVHLDDPKEAARRRRRAVAIGNNWLLSPAFANCAQNPGDDLISRRVQVCVRARGRLACQPRARPSVCLAC